MNNITLYETKLSKSINDVLQNIPGVINDIIVLYTNPVISLTKFVVEDSKICPYNKKSSKKSNKKSSKTSKTNNDNKFVDLDDETFSGQMDITIIDDNVYKGIYSASLSKIYDSIQNKLCECDPVKNRYLIQSFVHNIITKTKSVPFNNGREIRSMTDIIINETSLGDIVYNEHGLHCDIFPCQVYKNKLYTLCWIYEGNRHGKIAILTYDITTERVELFYKFKKESESDNKTYIFIPKFNDDGIMFVTDDYLYIPRHKTTNIIYRYDIIHNKLDKIQHNFVKHISNNYIYSRITENSILITDIHTKATICIINCAGSIFNGNTLYVYNKSYHEIYTIS